MIRGFLRKSNFSNPIIFWVVSNIILLLIIVGHSVTVPIRGEVALGVNYASDDGPAYALKALELSGIPKLESCKIVEVKFNEWAIWNEKQPYSVCNKNLSFSEQQRKNYIIDNLYGPRLIYPHLTSIIYPFFGINSIILIPIIFFIILINLQLSIIRNYKNTNFIFLILLLYLSSKHFIQLSLSTAATDLIHSVLVVGLFVILRSKYNPKVLIPLTIICMVLSTFNKQSQAFWLILGVFMILISLIYKNSIRTKFRNMGCTILFCQPISYYFVEKTYKSFSAGEKIGLFPIVNINNKTTLLEFITDFLPKIVINDLASILTKDSSTFAIFLCYLVGALILFSKRHKYKESIEAFTITILFSTGVLFGCLTNVLIQGIGNIFLRMYLPFISLGLIILVEVSEKLIRNKS